MKPTFLQLLTVFQDESCKFLSNHFPLVYSNFSVQVSSEFCQHHLFYGKFNIFPSNQRFYYKEDTKELISRNFFSVIAFTFYVTTAIVSSQKFCQINELKNFTIQNQFDEKNSVAVNFSFFHTVCITVSQCGKMRNSLSPKKYFIQSTL